MKSNSAKTSAPSAGTSPKTKSPNSTPPAPPNPPTPIGTSASLSPTATPPRFRFASSLATREWWATSKVLSLLRPSLPPDGIFLFSYRSCVRLPKRIHCSLRQPIQAHARSENMPVQHRPQQQRHAQFLIQNRRKYSAIHSPAQQHSQAGARGPSLAFSTRGQTL